MTPGQALPGPRCGPGGDLVPPSHSITYHTMLLFARYYRLIQFISYIVFFWELWEECLRTRPPPQIHWTKNWLMNPKCHNEFKFQDIKIPRCPSSHGDMYLIITFYGSITITFKSYTKQKIWATDIWTIENLYSSIPISGKGIKREVKQMMTYVRSK